MTTILSILTIAFTLLFVSCDKDDDPAPPPTKSKEELLTQHTWKMEEITQVENNALIYYKRGGTTNTHNFDNDKLTFAANGTGTYSPTPAQTHTTTWQFTNAEKTRMNLAINFGPGLITTLTCTDVELEENRFFCVARFSNASGQPVLASVYRTPL